MPPLADREWVLKHLSPLVNSGKEILQKTSTTLSKDALTYDKGSWTGLKLILLKYYLRPYLDIFGKQRKKVAYVDLFAGPGLNRIGDTRVPVLGSPIIPLIIRESKWQFAAFIFSELNRDYFDALNARISIINPSPVPKVFLEDANSMVEKLPDLLKGIDHALVFLDPEGMEMNWESLARLCQSVNCDLIINFPSSGITRNLQLAQSADRMATFLGLGSERVPLDAGEEWAISIYRSKLQGIGKDISTEIKVKSGDGPFHYHLIPAVRTTAGGSPWFDIFLEAKARIERMSGQVLHYITEQMEGNQSTL